MHRLLLNRVLILAAWPFISASSEAADAPAPRDPARIVAELCVGCHGPNLTGGNAPNLLDDTWKYGADDESVLRSIRVGSPATGMPGFEAAVNESELRALLRYLRWQRNRFAMGMVPRSVPPPATVSLSSELHEFRLETFAAPLDTPWGIAFLPDGKMLVSDRVGLVRVIEKDGTLHPEPIRDTPQPFVKQDGGMLDVIAHPDYEKNGWLYLAYSEEGTKKGMTMTVIVRGKIRDGAWVEQQAIFRAPQELYYSDFSHYGCRFLFDRKGHLFFTLGERGHALDAQDLRNPLGKIHRIFDDGRVPPDNPFVANKDAWPSIWSYGNRHVQGLQFHPTTGRLWAAEHGPRGGDELNRIEPGRNYGWPIVSHGVPQVREIIEARSRPGMEDPIASWTPSIAPSGIEFYTGTRFPRWKNHLFMATLIGQHLRRIELDGDKVVHEEILFKGMGRVRDVTTGPDGFIYVALNNPGRIARLVPTDTDPEKH